jgi:hypothetical protein
MEILSSAFNASSRRISISSVFTASIYHDVAFSNPRAPFLRHLTAAIAPHEVFLDGKSPLRLVLRQPLREQLGRKDVLSWVADSPTAFARRILQYTCSIQIRSHPPTAVPDSRHETTLESYQRPFTTRFSIARSPSSTSSKAYPASCSNNQ